MNHVPSIPRASLRTGTRAPLRPAATRPATLALLSVLTVCWFGCGPGPTSPEGAGTAADTNAPAAATATNLPASGTNAPPPGATNVVTPLPGVTNVAALPPGMAPPGAPVPPGTPTPADPAEGIQIAFQGAPVDMIVQWLAQNTGKTVVKHPRVQCQLTIVSSKKVSVREALELVYRALALEGFNVIETRNSILLIPEGQDLKLSPEILNAASADIPEGRQRIMKIFPTTHVPAAELRDKIRGLLSERGTAEADERAGALIVTDFNENLRLVAELLAELDVVSVGDATVEIFPLKHAEVDELANLIGLILNAQTGSGSGASAAALRAASPMPMGGPPGMPGMPSGGPSPSPSPGPSASPAPSGGSSSQIRLWPDRTANRLIVSAPRSRIADVRRLVELLDTDSPGDVTVRVLPLKHVAAADLVKEVQPLYQKMNVRAPKESVEIAANERSNSLIILSSESSYKLVSEFVASLDTADAQEKVIRTFPLKNADAQDVAKQLQTLHQDAESTSPYRYIYFGGDSSQRSSKKFSVVADRRRNSIVVQAPPAQMEGLARMIRELDEPVADDALAPRIFALKYVSAVDIEDVLNQLFLRRTERRPYWYYDEFESDSTSADRDVGRLYGKVRITSEPYSNTLIVTSNSKENLAVVEDILKQLDVPSQAGETTVRFPLRFATAASMANSLNILFAKNGSPPLRPTQPQANPNVPQPQPQTQNAGVPAQSSFELSLESREDGYFPWLGGQPDSPRGTDGRTATRQVSDLVGRVRVVPDERSNALLVSANLHLLPQITRLIEELDAPTAQVLIEARILEVSTEKLDRLGVRWSPDGSQVYSGDDYDNSILGSTRGRYTTGFGGKTEVNSPAGEAASAITTIRSGVLSSTVNLDVLVQFLRRTTDATVLAAPQINIADNELGRLFVGQQVPFVDQSQSTDVGSLVQSFEYKLVGVILEVTPRINNAGEVSLRIRAESSAIVPGQTVLGGAVVDTRNFRTDVTTKDGEILVLGGIIQKQISDTIRKVPVLGDIPGLGWAFKKKDKTARNVELMVFLRPKITRTPAEARKLLEDLDTTAPLIAPWKEGGFPTSSRDTGKPAEPPTTP